MTALTVWRPAPARLYHALRAVPGICECPQCGLVQRLCALPPGFVARCTRCQAMLGRRRTTPPIATPLAFCVSALVLYLISITQPLMTISIYGRMRAISLFTGPIELVREGWTLAGLLVGAVTVAVPAIEIVLMLGVLFGALHHRLPWRVPRMMRWYDLLRPWSMIEVYLLGLLVAYTKMIDLADVSVDPAAYALFGLTLMMAATDSSLDEDVIWSRRRVRLLHRNVGDYVGIQAGGTPAGTHAADHRGDAASGPGDAGGHGKALPPLDHLVSCRSCALVCYSEAPLDRELCVGACPRCGKALRRRKPDGLSRAMILVFCATILYIPANVFPIMTIIQLHRGGGHTIVQGVGELYEAHMLPLALLVFFASITVPILKILSLTLMCVNAWRGSASRLVGRTRLYRIVDFIGRWSMIDVFMVSILVAMVQYGPLADVRADGGMFAFASVVVLTIFAANCFDPRVMWDAAGLNGRLLATPLARARARAPEPLGA